MRLIIGIDKGEGCMPGITTHLNFSRLLKNGGLCNNNYYYFILGSMAPDYYISFYDEKMGLISHFKTSTSDKSNLDYFQELSGFYELNGKEQAYIIGYYSHLWLDNYIFDFGNTLTENKIEGMDERHHRQLFKKNIELYDLQNIRLELDDLAKCLFSSERFISNLPVSPIKAYEVLKPLINPNIDKALNANIPRIINESEYNKFLEHASVIFLNEKLPF